MVYKLFLKCLIDLRHIIVQTFYSKHRLSLYLIVLLMEVGLLHRITRKPLHRCRGDCGVARFIQVEMEGCPCVPSPIIPRWKKSNCASHKARTKASVQSFCAIFPTLVVSVPIQVAELRSRLCGLYPGSGVEPAFGVCATAREGSVRHSWLLWRQRANKQGQRMYLGERERASLLK